MDLMTSEVDMGAGSGQFIIDAYVRKACKYLIARLASQNRVNIESLFEIKASRILACDMFYVSYNKTTCTLLIILQFSVRYELLGEKFKPESKKCRVRLKVKMEEYIGNGPTIRTAKKNASLKVRAIRLFSNVRLVHGTNVASLAQCERSKRRIYLHCCMFCLCF